MNLKKIPLLIMTFFIFSCGISYNIPSFKGTVKFQPKKDDLFTKSDLQKLLKENQTPSIVIRVPKSNNFILNEDNYSNSDIYSVIEKELTKSGFLVRDRGLFNKIVMDNKIVNYSELGNKTDTDLILEVVSFKNVKFVTNKYVNNRGKEKVAPFDVRYKGVKIEFKLIKVDNNSVAGNYVFYYTPCVNGCSRLYFSNGLNYPINYKGNVPWITKHEYIIDKTGTEEFYSSVAKRLVKALKQ